MARAMLPPPLLQRLLLGEEAAVLPRDPEAVFARLLGVGGRSALVALGGRRRDSWQRPEEGAGGGEGARDEEPLPVRRPLGQEVAEEHQVEGRGRVLKDQRERAKWQPATQDLIELVQARRDQRRAVRPRARAGQVSLAGRSGTRPHEAARHAERSGKADGKLC